MDSKALDRWTDEVQALLTLYTKVWYPAASGDGEAEEAKIVLKKGIITPTVPVEGPADGSEICIPARI